MSQARLDVMAVRSRLSSSTLKGWLKRARHRLYEYRPRFRNWHFWAVQGLVIGIAAIHDIIEVGGYLPSLGMLYFVPISLFFVPVVYAALNFGFAGALATALWATVITIPNFVFWHEGLERLGVLFQLLIVNAVAIFVGQRVDRETGARRQAEAAGDALRASEMKYRGLFESSPIAILVLDTNGAILDANPAAGALFGKAVETLKSMVAVDLVGMENAQKLLVFSQKDKWQEASLTLCLRDSPEVYLEPTKTQVSDSQGNITIQILLRDVTQERHRQAGLRAYAAYVLRAQEEERQRIARELHDDTTQALVLICRRLDSAEASGKSLPSLVIHELREARRTAEEVVKGLREFTTALRPPALDDLGIVASIRRLLLDLADRSTIDTQLKVVGEYQRLPSDTELGIFRIVQEALRNAERHARATRITVTITCTEHEVKLDVLDNGIGFTTPSPADNFVATRQLGLIGMQERAELLGGRLQVQSNPGKGTKITVSIHAPEGIAEVPDHHPDH